jgi:hypothetical protein
VQEPFVSDTLTDIVCYFVYYCNDPEIDFEAVRDAHWRWHLLALFDPLIATNYGLAGMTPNYARWDWPVNSEWTAEAVNEVPGEIYGERGMHKLSPPFFAMKIVLKVKTQFYALAS